jgi:D-inositol-3-phosphate glycosyltransferase
VLQGPAHEPPDTKGSGVSQYPAHPAHAGSRQQPGSAADLRVAVIEPVGGHGGMNFYDLSLCQGLVQAGAQATLYTCDKTTVTGNEGFAVRQPYRHIYGPSPAWRRGLRFLRGSLLGLLQAKRSGHRLAHFHFFHVGPLELFNVCWARCLGLCVVITAHDVEAFKEGLSVPRFLRWAYGAAHRVIAHSQIAKRELTQELLLPPDKVEVIRHGNYLAGVPAEVTPEAARAHLGLTAEMRVLLFFGQIKDVKGLDVLLRGFALARQADPLLHLVIAGRVWKTDFGRYQALIQRLQLAPFCSLHIRYIADAELPFFYRAADLVVLPYRRIYQSGVVLLAMSYGKPVLVSNIDGMLEVVNDEDTGFVFRSSEPEHLAQRLLQIFATPGRAAQVGLAGLRQVKLRNDWGLLGVQTLACYRRALQAQGGS